MWAGKSARARVESRGHERPLRGRATYRTQRIGVHTARHFHWTTVSRVSSTLATTSALSSSNTTLAVLSAFPSRRRAPRSTQTGLRSFLGSKHWSKHYQHSRRLAEAGGGRFAGSQDQVHAVGLAGSHRARLLGGAHACYSTRGLLSVSSLEYRPTTRNSVLFYRSRAGW